MNRTNNIVTSTPKLVVMLTENDLTVRNASELFDQCKDLDVQYWGIKEHPLPLKQMAQLFASMKALGKTTFLEVVAYTESEGLDGAMMAAECGCDVLMGTMFSKSINRFCQNHGLKYMPFVGNVTGRPSILEGSIDGMITEAKMYLNEGVYGIDLLGYRFRGDSVQLNKRMVQSVAAPVCLAGSINSYERLDEVKDASPWAFTIGSAFFEQKFGPDLCSQIKSVADYVKQDKPKC